MALLKFIIASISTLLASLFTFSPTSFHGLVPWIGYRSPHPVTPSPTASPVPFSLTPTFWEGIPIANLSTVDTFPSPPPPPPPMPTFTVVFEEEDDQSSTVPPLEDDEPTAEELLRELFRLLRQAVLCLTIKIDGFLKDHPYLKREVTKCRLHRVFFWHIPIRQSRSHPLRCSPAQFRFAARMRAASCLPGAKSTSAPAPAVASFLPSPPTPPSPRSVLVSPAPPPSSPTSALSIAEHQHLVTETREQRNRILELEEEVQSLVSKIAEMQRCKTAPAPAPATPQSGQPVSSTGSAPPLPPSGPPVFSTGSAPPFGFGYHPPRQPASFHPQHFGFGYPPQPPPLQASSRPPAYAQARRPDQLSIDEFLKKYPQTGSKKEY